ncbi:MAG: DUF2158 domain-containing protein [Pseudomonadota bacterium]
MIDLNNLLKIGDVVKVKSGSKKMTIEKIENEKITCIYASNDGIKHTEIYEKDTLVVIKKRKIEFSIDR